MEVKITTDIITLKEENGNGGEDDKTNKSLRIEQYKKDIKSRTEKYKDDLNLKQLIKYFTHVSSTGDDCLPELTSLCFLCKEEIKPNLVDCRCSYLTCPNISNGKISDKYDICCQKCCYALLLLYLPNHYQESLNYHGYRPPFNMTIDGFEHVVIRYTSIC